MSGVVQTDATRLFSARPMETFWCPQSTVSIWRPALGVLVTRTVGVLTEGGAAAMEAAVRRQVLEEGRHLGFHDWEEMTDYEPNARTRLTSLGLTTLRALDGAHFVLRSRLVAFGVQIAHVIVPKLTVHPTRAAFEQALTAVLRSRGQTRPPSMAPRSSRRPPF